MAQDETEEPKYGGYTRFELELEVCNALRYPTQFLDTQIIKIPKPRLTSSLQFVQSLSNPHYLSHLASQKILEDAEFVAYIEYLQYWKQPQYLRYLSYPGPTLKALELLRVERFRREILSPEVVAALIREGSAARAG